MNSMILIVLTNAAIAAIMFALVIAAKPCIKNPALLHCLWLLVLLKLLTPSLWTPRWELLPATEPTAEVTSTSSDRPNLQTRIETDATSDEFTTSSVTRPAVTIRGPEPKTPNRPTTSRPQPVLTRHFTLPVLSWQQILLVIWGVGAGCWWGLSLWRIFCMERCLRFATDAGEEVQTKLAALGNSLGLRRVPPVLQVPGCVSPMLWSFCGSARIVVPQDLFKDLDEPSRKTLLLHELVHYRRGDHWVRWLELAALGLYWWNPIVWLLRRHIHVAEELACDACVVSQRPYDRRAYAEMLVSTVEFLSSANVPILATGVGSTRHLEERLKMIMRSAKEARISVRMRVVVSVIAVLLLPLAPVFVRAQRAADKVAEAPAAADLQGTVVDEAGKPVAGIQVKAFFEGRPLEVAFKTNDSGQFKIPASWHAGDANDSRAVLVVRQKATHLGWLSLRSLLWNDPKKPNPAIVKDGFRIVLLPLSKVVRGTLVTPDGMPVQGVRMSVDGMSQPQNQSINHWDVGENNLFVTTTDRDGAFELHLPEEAQAGLEPWHPDWQRRHVNITQKTKDLGRITLHPAGRIEGRVIDAASGQPLSGQRVLAQTERRSEPYQNLVNFGQATTDQDGRYVIGGLTPGNFNVMFGGIVSPGAEQSGLTAAAVEGVDVQVGKPARADLKASAGRRLSGKVIDGETGLPIAKISVGYYGPARPRSTAACIMVKTKEDGTFEFRVPPGVSRVYVAEGGQLHQTDSNRTLEVPADRDLENVVLKAKKMSAGDSASFGEAVDVAVPQPQENQTAIKRQPYMLHVNFIPPAGQKVKYAEARISAKGSDHASSSVALSATGNEVTFIPRDDGHRFFLLIDAEGFAAVRSKEFVVTAQMPDLNVELVPEVIVPVRGRLIDMNGAAVAGARVRVERAIYGTETKFPWGLEYTTADDGRFEIKHTRQGDKIQLRIDKPGTGGAESDWLTLNSPEPRTMPDLKLSGLTHETAGVVRDQFGIAFKNAKIIYLGEPQIETTTDAEGKFRLSGLPTGEIPVAIVPKDFPRYDRMLRAGKLDYRISLFTRRAKDTDHYQVEVTLKPADQKEVSHVTLYLCAENGPLLTWMPDRKGNLHKVYIEELVRRTPGQKLEIYVAAEGYAWSAPKVVQAEKNPKPAEINLKPAAPATIRGRVVDEVGQPVAGARVGLSTLLSKTAEYKPWQYLDEQSHLPVTDANGKFELKDIQPNCRVLVYINKIGYSGVASEPLSVELPGSIDLPDMHLSKATGELSGRVVDQEGKPVAEAFVTVHDITPLEATTDAQGRFRLQGVPNKELSINVRSEVGGWYKRLTPDGKELEIKVSKRYPDD